MRSAQTVLLTTSPRSKPQNSRFFPKLSEAFQNPNPQTTEFFFNVRNLNMAGIYQSRCGGKTGNGANFGLFRGANKACVACGEKGRSCHFRRPFLVHFLGEQKMNRKTVRKNY
jgi:hypothetical protein